MARSRRPRRIRERHGVWHPHAALPCVAALGHDATRGPDGARQWVRRTEDAARKLRDLVATLRARRGASGWGGAAGVLRRRSGTGFGIRADGDGLLACGVPGVQLTWMDAKVGDWVVTPRIGKPVEVQALWINALWIGLQASSRWEHLFERACASFAERFWNESTGGLFDVIDREHRRGANDASFRPNQILAVGGLPLALPEGQRARRVVESWRSACVHCSAFARSRPANPIMPPLRGWCPAARRRVQPGHGLAVAGRSLRRGVAARPREHRRSKGRSAGAFSSRRCTSISPPPASAIFPRSRTPTRRTHPEDAPSKHGRRANCYGSRRSSRSDRPLSGEHPAADQNYGGEAASKTQGGETPPSL